jgi:hypothetical protein
MCSEVTAQRFKVHQFKNNHQSPKRPKNPPQNIRPIGPIPPLCQQVNSTSQTASTTCSAKTAILARSKILVLSVLFPPNPKSTTFAFGTTPLQFTIVLPQKTNYHQPCTINDGKGKQRAAQRPPLPKMPNINIDVEPVWNLK